MIQIQRKQFPNTLVDLGATINIITKEAWETQYLAHLRRTLTFLELENRSTIKPEGIIEYVSILVDSWEYPADFLVLQT